MSDLSQVLEVDDICTFWIDISYLSDNIRSRAKRLMSDFKFHLLIVLLNFHVNYRQDRFIEAG